MKILFAFLLLLCSTILVQANTSMPTSGFKFSFETILKVNDATIAITENAKVIDQSDKFIKLISILALALISILSLLSLSLYKNNIIRTKSNELLEAKNKELFLAKEEAVKAYQARSEFLSTVSHELRTPLNAINGIAHLLYEENPKPSQLQYLESLKFSGDYLTKFISDILEINKIESNKLELENVNFNLKQLLFGIQNSLKELAIAKNNSFSLEIDPNIPEYLMGDSTKISQIILNLINNSLKFTKNGSIAVMAKLTSIHNATHHIYFEISDTGIGIPTEKHESIFESFSQGSVEINRKYGGSGLGLTIVKKLVAHLGGTIGLTSVVDVGSTFYFSLPFEIGKITNEILFLNSPKKQILNLVNKRVLVVEDNKINQMISRKMLENKGIVCDIVDNGEEAVLIAKTNSFDLILMDVHLPGINGTEATKRIRDFDAKTPIIALTAISLDENKEMLLSYGMNDVITKPFVPENFYSCINYYLN